MLRNTTPQTTVLKSNAAGWQPAILTWYDPALGGTNSASGQPSPHSRTASGEAYDPTKDTCAAPPTYPFGTQITFRYGNSMVVCRVNDRGGAITGNHFDLSRHAAQALGIIGAGRVTASFQVGAISGAPAASQPGNISAGGGGGSGGGMDLLSALSDLLTGDLEGFAAQMAMAGVTVIKDVALGFADWIIIPWWHWNQRAVQYYYSDELLSDDPKKWTVIPWTAVFWGFGYWLFWTDPDAKSARPAPIRSSRAARHVRALQAIPARRSLIKPADVKGKTPHKPKPVISTALLSQTGTMRVTRAQPVTVTGEHVARRETASTIPIDGAGTLPREKTTDNGRGTSDPARSKPNPRDRTGNGSLPNSGGIANPRKETR